MRFATSREKVLHQLTYLHTILHVLYFRKYMMYIYNQTAILGEFDRIRRIIDAGIDLAEQLLPRQSLDNQMQMTIEQYMLNHTGLQQLDVLLKTTETAVKNLAEIYNTKIKTLMRQLPNPLPQLYVRMIAFERMKVEIEIINITKSTRLFNAIENIKICDKDFDEKLNNVKLAFFASGHKFAPLYNFDDI